MRILEKRRVQKVKDKNTLLIVIPKIVTAFLGLQKSDKLIFKNEKDKIVIEKE